MDPIVVNNEAINETKKEVVDMINEHFPGVTIHDFRMIQGPTHTNLIFDAVVPFQYGKTNEEVKQGIEKLISEKWDDITQSYRQSSHIWNKEKRLNPAECAEALCRIFAVKENVRSLQEKGFAIAWLNCYT